MKAKINYENLVRQLLPNFKRQPGRLSVLRAMSEPLAELLYGNAEEGGAALVAFEEWCKQIRREINMTSQVGVLENYLRHKYGDPNIRIETYKEEGIGIGLISEGENSARFIGFGTAPLAIPLSWENRSQYDFADFVVYISRAENEEAVRADIEKYKLAFVTYKIITE